MRTGDRESLPIKGRFGGIVYILCVQCTLRTGSTPVFSTRRQLSGCRFFLFPCTPRTGDRPSLPYQREVWRVCLYLVCAMHIAHRFDPGILHQGDNFRVVAFFVSCTMRTGDRESLPYQREVWRDCLCLLCAMHIAHRFDPGILHQGDNFRVVAFLLHPPPVTSFGGGKLLNTYLKQRIFVCFFGITRGFFYLCDFILVRFFTF